MKHALFLFSLLLCFVRTPAIAQIGREFWFAAPEVTSLHADEPVRLVVSSFDKAAVITISQPANSSFKTISVSLPANTTQSINLSSQLNLIETKPANQILTTGLFIKSTEDISVYYEVDGSDYQGIVNSDIFVLKGNNALGDTFFIPMQTFWNNQSDIDAWASFDIVATENNTTVTITPSQNIVGHVANNPFSVVLNKGQTYSARASSILGSLRPSGSKVVANKPVAITLKDDSMFQDDPKDDNAYGSWDLAGDQLVSVRDIGSEYIAVRASGIFGRDRIFVTPTEDNTFLYLANDTIELQTGKTFAYLLSQDAEYIRTSAPVYIFHVAAFKDELGGALLPSLSCTGTKSTSFVRSNEEEFALLVLVKTGGEAYFKVNDSKDILPADSFLFVQGTNNNWKYAYIKYDLTKVQAGKPYSVKNDSMDFHLSTMNGGLETGFRYGYFSGYGFVNLGTDKFLCKGDSATIEAGAGKDSYVWSNGLTSSSITVKDTGIYFVSVKKGTCTFSDTVKVLYNPPVLKGFLGQDTGVCSNVPILLKTSLPFQNYVWQDNSTGATYRPIKSGTYSVSVTDANGCKGADTLLFVLYALPEPQIVYNQNAAQFCEDSLVSLSANAVFSKYLWQDGQTTFSISTEHTLKNEYTLQVTTERGCQAKASIKIDCSPFISIPNVFTPNGDSVNDRFNIKNAETGNWRLEVFNRWGSKVFHAQPYLNDWEANGVPDGIYYYTLQNTDLQKNIKGWVQIIR